MQLRSFQPVSSTGRWARFWRTWRRRGPRERADAELAAVQAKLGIML